MEKLLQSLKTFISKNNVDKIIIAIDGRGGSGKSTISKTLAQNLSQSEVINLDAYQMDSADLFAQENIDKGFEIDFENRKFRINEIKDLINSSPNRIFILEGCFNFKNLEDIAVDYRIWVDVSMAEAAKRLNDREKADRKEIDPGVIELSTQKYQEAEDRYIDSFNPQSKADFIINSSNES